jgi:hypothetical protein
MRIASTVTMVSLLVLSDPVTPVMLIWGWVRWARRSKSRTLTSLSSLSGFVLATSSTLLAIASLAYAHVHPFGFYDPKRLRICGWGTMLSLAGMLFAVGGAWRKSSIRWHALICTFGTLSFWILAAAGE